MTDSDQDSTTNVSQSGGADFNALGIARGACDMIG